MSIFAVLASAVGCATTPPIPTEITTITGDPELFRNKRVELQGRVEDYEPPRGDRIRTWGFALRDLEGNRMQVYAEGRYPDDVEAAHALVRRAIDDQAPVFVIGRLRTGRYGSRSGSPRLDLTEVQYRQDVVRLRPRQTYYDASYPVHIGVGYYHGGHHGGHHYGYSYGYNFGSHHKSDRKRHHGGHSGAYSGGGTRADHRTD